MFRNSKRISNKTVLDFAVFLSFFGLTVLTLTGLQVFREAHADTDIAAVVAQTGYYINATSSALNGSINMNVDATPGGTMAVVKDTLNIKSNVPNGYNIYIAMKDTNALKLDNSSATLPATSGTFASPTALSVNTWGYAIAKSTTGAPSNNFNTSYNPSIPDKNSVWAALPVKGNDQLIQSITTPNSDTGINADVFYGANISTALTSGIYRGEIVYTIVAKNAAGVAEIASVSPNKTKKLEGGEVLTISTNYTFTPANAGTIQVFVNSLTSSKACTNPTATTVEGTLSITCIAPAFETGKYDIRLVIPNYGKDITMTRALTYYIDSGDAANLRNALVSGFNSESLSSTVSSKYYGGDTVPLSDLVDVYTQQYDGDKTPAQNTEDSGITWDEDGETIHIAPGYHGAQDIHAKVDYSGASGEMTMYSNLHTQQSWHLWCNQDQGHRAEYQSQYSNTYSQTFTTEGNIKGMSISVPEKTQSTTLWGYYISPGRAGFTATGTRANGTTNQFANLTDWTSEQKFDISEYTSVSYTLSLTGSYQGRPDECEYDLYSAAHVNAKLGLMTFVP